MTTITYYPDCEQEKEHKQKKRRKALSLLMCEIIIQLIHYFHALQFQQLHRYLFLPAGIAL